MFNLVSRIPDGLGELRNLLENHIWNRGLNAISKCGDQAFNVSLETSGSLLLYVYHVVYHVMVLRAE